MDKHKIWDSLDNVDPHTQISKDPAPFCMHRPVLQGDELSIPRAQRRAPVPSLAAIARKHRDRDDAIVTAYGTGAYSYREFAKHFQLHLAILGQIIRARMLQCEN